MLRKLTRKYRMLRELASGLRPFPDDFQRFEKLVITAPMSPIDRHVTLHMATHKRAIFAISYAFWRTNRINKLLEIYGLDYFAGRRILELGAGLCDIGAFFADLGAQVTCLEGREDTVRFAKLKHRRVEGLRIEEFDVENDFSSFGRFDLILHFGLLYHVPKPDEQLEWCFAMTDDLVVESVVCDSDDPYKNVIVDEEEEVLEEALHGKGCRPSPAFIERIAQENGFEIERHFSGDLNVDNKFVYDWTPKNDGNLGGWRNRRFWRFKRSQTD